MEIEENHQPAAKKACAICNREFTTETSFCPDDGALLSPVIRKASSGTLLAQRYEVREEIGDGGMGQVYKARDKTLKRFVAFKMLLPALAASPGARVRFQHEAQAVSALNHPHIVGIHDFGVTEASEPYMVFGYIDGISLGALLDEEKKLEEVRAVNIFCQICSALSHAHKAGMIHRDLKPRNVLLTTVDGEPDYVKVIDFGIAKLLTHDSDAHELTRTGDIFGTAEYMSPEQCRGDKLDARSDIYSLGCVMYKTVSGRLPFVGQSRDELMKQHLHETPMKCSQLLGLAPVSPALEVIIFKCLHKVPDNRFQTMSELKEALLNTDAGRSLPQSDTGGKTVVHRAKPSGAPGTVDRQWSMRTPAWQVFALLAVFVAALLLVTSFPYKKPETQELPAETPGAKSLKPDKRFDDLMKKAWDYWDKGDYVNTLLDAREAEKRAEALGPEDPRIGKAIYMQGLCDWASGQYQASSSELSEALELVSKGYGADGLDYAEVETALGVALADLGKFKDAEHYIREGMKTRKRLAAVDSQELADSAAALGYLYEKQKQFPLAIKQLTEALYISQRAGNDQYQDTEYFTVTLADAYRMSGQYSTAEMLYAKALVKNLGPYRVQAESGLANNYLKQKKYQEAAHHAKLAEDLYDQQLGPENLKSPEMRKVREEAEQAAKGRFKS